MAILAEYLKPKTVPQALELLAERTVRRIPLAGGTHLVGALETRQRQDVDGVVDLAGLALSYIEQDGGVLRVGAMTTLADLIGHPLCAALAGGILPRTARFEGPQNLRNAATVGGLVGLAEPDSELYAALLALAASVVTIDYAGVETVGPLADRSGRQPRAPTPVLITELRLPLAPTVGGHARIARTPMDRCIVAAVAVTALESSPSPSSRTDAASEGDNARIALCGVGPRPLLAGAAFNAPGDFKGSAEYRLAMAAVVRRRAVIDQRELAALQD